MSADFSDALPAGQLRHRGVAALQHLLEHAPAGGALALWCAHEDLEEGDPRLAPVASPPLLTDGRALLYAPGFEALPLPRQAGWVAHAVLHIALRHVQRLRVLHARTGDVDAQLFNLCADAVVNSALAALPWLQLPAGALLLEQLLDRVLERHQSAESALAQWDVEALYRAVDDRRPGPGSAGALGGRHPTRAQASGAAAGRASRQEPGRGAGQTGGQTDRLDRPGNERSAKDAGGGPRNDGHAGAMQDGPRAQRLRALAGGVGGDLRPAPQDSAADADETELARRWRERLLRSQAGGPEGALLRWLVADLPRSDTPWEQVLRLRMARALSTRTSLSWSRPTRAYLANQGRAGPHCRLPWEPGTVASRAVPRVALVVDASGSIDDDLLARFAREVRALTRRLQAPLVRIVGDDAVRDVRVVPPGDEVLGPRGTSVDRAAGALRGPLAATSGLTAPARSGIHAGGGTDFTPLLQEAARHRPDLVIVLTDLDGPARFRPACPVLWAVDEAHAAAPLPFGRRLVLR